MAQGAGPGCRQGSKKLQWAGHVPGTPPGPSSTLLFARSLMWTPFSPGWLPSDLKGSWKGDGGEGGDLSSPGSLLGQPHLPILPLLSGWPSPHHSLLGPRSHAFPLFLQAQQSWPLGCYHPVRLPFPEAPTPTPLYVYAPRVIPFWVGFLLLGHWLMLSALSLPLGL